MPTERLSMRRIREVLRLKHASGLSERLIARTLQISNGAVNSYLQRARVAGLAWPLPDPLDDEALERLQPLVHPVDDRLAVSVAVQLPGI